MKQNPEHVDSAVLERYATGGRGIAADTLWAVEAHLESCGLCRARLEPNEIGLLQLDFGGVLDEEDTVLAGNEPAERVQQGGLAASGSATDEDVLAVLNIPLQPGSKFTVQSAYSHEVLDCEMTAVEFTDGECHAVNAAWRNHDGDAG